MFFSYSIEVSQPSLISELLKTRVKSLDLSGFEDYLSTTEAWKREKLNI